MLCEEGVFTTGCNYWASHAGTAMWSDWKPDIVKKDLEQIASSGMKVIRAFPLWSDFQPIKLLYGCSGAPHEYRFGEGALPQTDAGRNGVSEEMMERFRTFADMVHENGMKLAVGLITGWMSGRLFVPPALEGRNVLNDPLAVIWQVRFAKYFVKQLKNHPAILAWDLGNECNCMGTATKEEAWAWSASITNAVKSEDISHPVISGMHGLKPAPNAIWSIQDQGEITDILTVHPYPRFTPHCDRDPVNTVRNCLHAVAEASMYADIGGKPCIVEEIGTLGNMICSEKVAAEYMNTVLYSSWAHDCRSLLWWCAYDQDHLEKAPYDWNSVERELGLFRKDRTSKPVLEVFKKFNSFIDKLPFESLPPRMTDAVCVLTQGQDNWGAAFSSFILAKQAGFDMEFQYAGQQLKEAELYIMPSVCGGAPTSRAYWLELLERVHGGATLLLTHDDCILAPFNECFGLEVISRERRKAPVLFLMLADCWNISFECASDIKLNMRATTASVLASEADGNPVLTCNEYGKGKIFFLSVPIETYLSKLAGAFHAQDAQPFWKIYNHIAKPLIRKNRSVFNDNPFIGITEHPVSDTERLVVAINYSREKIKTELNFTESWKLKEFILKEESGISPERPLILKMLRK